MPEKLFDTEPDYLKNLKMLESSGDYNAYNAGHYGAYQISDGEWKEVMGLAPKTKENQDEAMRRITRRNYWILRQKLGRIPTCAELASAHNLGRKGSWHAIQHPEEATHWSEYGDPKIDNDHYYQNLASAYLYKEGNTHTYHTQSQLPKYLTQFPPSREDTHKEVACEVTAPITSMITEKRYMPQSLNPRLYGTPHPAHNPPPIPPLRYQTPDHRISSPNRQQNHMGAPYAQQNTHTAFPSPFENVLNSHPAASQTPYVQAMSPFTENSPPFSSNTQQSQIGEAYPSPTGFEPSPSSSLIYKRLAALASDFGLDSLLK